MRCTFCGEEMPVASGHMYVKKDGKVLYFCKAKCRRNMIDLGRKPREIRWTAEGREALAQAQAAKQ